jgi:hypothetical protein
MVADNLSGSEVIGAGANVHDLEKCIRLCIKDFPNTQFRFYDIGRGFDHSVRIFGEKLFADFVPLPKAMSPLEIAQELIKMVPHVEARYPHRDIENCIEGWEIHKFFDYKKNLFVVAHAKWIPPERKC